MKTIDQLASQLFLTDLIETPVYKEIQEELQSKHKQVDGEWPDEYWNELSDLLHAVLSRCVDMSLPQQ